MKSSSKKITVTATEWTEGEKAYCKEFKQGTEYIRQRLTGKLLDPKTGEVKKDFSTDVRVTKHRDGSRTIEFNKFYPYPLFADDLIGCLKNPGYTRSRMTRGSSKSPVPPAQLNLPLEQPAKPPVEETSTGTAHKIQDLVQQVNELVKDVSEIHTGLRSLSCRVDLLRASYSTIGLLPPRTKALTHVSMEEILLTIREDMKAFLAEVEGNRTTPKAKRFRHLNVHILWQLVHINPKLTQYVKSVTGEHGEKKWVVSPSILFPLKERVRSFYTDLLSARMRRCGGGSEKEYLYDEADFSARLLSIGCAHSAVPAERVRRWQRFMSLPVRASRAA
jgi:hypothetical protein